MPSARRHELGQWFTPPDVADLALALALPRGRGRSLRLLDPACGDGVFLARARATGIPASALSGIELDPSAADRCRARVPGAEVIAGDLFAVEPGAGAATGFDAVVGNPPYVRQERLPNATKERIRARLVADWPEAPPRDIDRLLGRGDLAVACILRALRLARPGARLALVVSSALFDAGYAAPLWRLIGLCGRVLAVVDAPRERWFPDAAVNAVILLVERGNARAEEVIVARLSVATGEAARRVRCLADLADVADVRRAPPDRPARWAAVLRASAFWFEVEERADRALVPLGDLADLRRGITSGANDVFYLTRARAADLGLEPALLAPLVRSPREKGAATIAIDPDRTAHVALVCPPERDALARYPAAQRYLDAHADRARRPTLRARPSWWSLPVSPARLFLTKAYAARFVQRLAPVPVVADQRVYSVHARPGVDVDLLAAVLNSTYTAFALESLGRASLGEGALEWTVADACGLPVLDPRLLRAESGSAALRALAACAARPIGTVVEERDRRDRRDLDRAVASAVPGLVACLARVHAGLVESVERRAAKARSA